MVELLVLGPDGAGKSLVIRRLVESSAAAEPAASDPSAEATIPTVGVNLTHVDLVAAAPSSSLLSLSLDVREIGATMASRWDSYLPDCTALLFVVDASDLGALASAFVLLYEVLMHTPHVAHKPAAVLLNKLDLVGDAAVALPTVCNVLRLDDLRRVYPRLRVLAGSAVDRHCGCAAAGVKTWLLGEQWTVAT